MDPNGRMKANQPQNLKGRNLINQSKMMRAVLILGLAVCARGLELEDEWTSFKTNHGRGYQGAEELYRKQVFSDNLDYIRLHNEAADKGSHPFWLGVNKFADMTNAEFKRLINGFQISASPKLNRNSLHIPRMSPQDLPTSVNWTEKGYTTPVKNQGMCGSCWAFSSTGSLEGAHFKKTGTLISLSEQDLIDCSSMEGNYGCLGGNMVNAFKYVKRNKGIDTEASYPYIGFADFEPCKFKKAHVGATLTGWKNIKNGSEADLLSAVAEVGPVSVAIDASHKSFQLYKHGVYVEPKCSSLNLDHGVLAAGYGVVNGTDYWLVKNSWGTKWGMEGYIMMQRNKNNMCGIATMASYPIV